MWPGLASVKSFLHSCRGLQGPSARSIFVLTNGCLTPTPDPPADSSMNSRRSFLIQAPVALLGAVAACRAEEQKPGAGGTTSVAATPGAPPAFNTAPPVGPEVAPATFAEAEKLVQVRMTETQRQTMAKSWRTSMAALLERRTGPRKI